MARLTLLAVVLVLGATATAGDKPREAALAVKAELDGDTARVTAKIASIAPTCGDKPCSYPN